MSTTAGENRVITEMLLADVEATERLAFEIAGCSERGDVITLSGDLGAGKTTFARFFIHAYGVAEEVPSPTFTLVQIYPTRGPTIWHFDFYRLTGVDDALEIGIDEAFAEGISLIEWPERIVERLPQERLDIELAFVEGSDTSREARLLGGNLWRTRLGRAGKTNPPS